VEKSADYLVSKEYEFNKNIKLILIVRNPVKRAISMDDTKLMLNYSQGWKKIYRRG